MLNEMGFRDDAWNFGHYVNFWLEMADQLDGKERKKYYKSMMKKRVGLNCHVFYVKFAKWLENPTKQGFSSIHERDYIQANEIYGKAIWKLTNNKCKEIRPNFV